MRYFVTGATGFIGHHLVKRLIGQGVTVRALVVEPTEIERLRADGVEVCFGDIGDPIDLVPDLKDVDIVIHCAGAAPARMGLLSEQAWAINVDGTERLLAASKAVGVRRFVFLSTSAVYRYSTPPIAEDAPIRPVGAYAQSKWAAEEQVWRYAQEGLPVVVLRPALVYGPGDTKFSQGIQRLARLPILPLPAGGERLLDLVYVTDLIESILAAATSPVAVGGAYNITDGQRHTVADLVRACEVTTGVSPTILPVPSAFLAAIPTLVRSLTSGGRQTVLAGRLAGLKILDLDIHFSIEAAQRDLSYRPQIGLQEGITKTLNRQTGQTAEATPTDAVNNGQGVHGVRKSAHLYDTKMQGRLSQEYYGHSDFYNWGYWRGDTRTQKEASETLVDVLLDLLPNKQGTILDVACGMGATTRRLLQHYDPTQVVGVNLSEAQLQRAQQNAPGVQFLLMNATELCFPDATFDSIICVEAAFHFDTRAALFRRSLSRSQARGKLGALGSAV